MVALSCHVPCVRVDWENTRGRTKDAHLYERNNTCVNDKIDNICTVMMQQFLSISIPCCFFNEARSNIGPEISQLRNGWVQVANATALGTSIFVNYCID